MTSMLFLATCVLYLAASLYLAHRCCHVLRVLHIGPVWLPLVVYGVVLLLDVGFLALRLLPTNTVWLPRLVYILSTEWMPIVLYGSVLLGLLDIARHVLEWFGYPTPYRTPQELLWTGLATLALMLYGHYVAADVSVMHTAIPSDKLPSGVKLKIAVASDLHTGYAVTRGNVEHLVELINPEHPDLVLLAGDLMDGQTTPVLSEDQGRPLEKLSAPLGTFAILGNHDYMAGDTLVERYFNSLRGVRVLRDDVAKIKVQGTENLEQATIAHEPADSCASSGFLINVVGRDDLTHLHRYQHERLPVDAFATDSGAFVVMLDHQPWDAQKAATTSTDLYIAGHTHGGQLFPFNLVTGALFPLQHGQAFYGHLCALVTSGFGTWGPRFRLLTRSEIWIVDIEGTRE